MKIENDAIRALLAQEEARRTTQTGAAAGKAGGFDALLSGQMQQASAVASPLEAGRAGEQSAAALALLMQSSGLLNQAEGAAGELSDGLDLEALAGSRIDGLLEQWESYAAALNGGTDLRSVYGMLQNMTEGVKELKSAMPELLASNAALGALVNELDVLSTTETIKFNRGDYL